MGSGVWCLEDAVWSVGSGHGAWGIGIGYDVSAHTHTCALECMCVCYEFTRKCEILPAAVRANVLVLFNRSSFKAVLPHSGRRKWLCGTCRQREKN